MGESLQDKLARIGDEAEAGEEDQTDRPMPAGVKVSRPNRARTKVLQVRLNPGEYEALEQIAAGRGVPVSALARDQLLDVVRQSARAMEATGDQLLGLVSLLAEVTEKLQEVTGHRSGDPVALGPGTRFLGGDPTTRIVGGPKMVRATTIPYETDPAVDDYGSAR